MRRIKFFALASVIALTACQNSENEQQTVEQRIPVELKQQALAISETRAAQNLNDSYIAKGQTVAVKITGDDTVYEYTTGENGAMTAPDPRPCYPSEGTIDITAYYPSTAGETFTVQTDQSADADYLASDLMFASKTGQAKTTDAVALEFEHKLSKIAVNVTAKDGINVTSITLKGVLPTVSFDAATGAVGNASGVATDIVIVTSGNKGAAVIPAQTLESKFLEIVTDAGTANYPVNKTFAASNVYTVNLTLQKTGVNTIAATANWTAGAVLTIDDIADQTFSGSPITPALTVTSDGTALTANTDYDLTWANNVNAGTATVLVIGKGNYEGCYGYKTFTINPLAASISYATAAISSSTLGEKITNPLAKTGDGTVAYTSSDTNVATVDATTGEVTVVNYGTATITATVTPTSNSTYETTTASFTLKVNDQLSTVTSNDIGKVICSNRHIHSSTNDLCEGGTAVAMIAYVGKNGKGSTKCEHGLAYALTNAVYNTSTSKTTFGGSQNTEANTCVYILYHRWNAYGFAVNNDNNATTGWRIPSVDDYKNMFAACGGATYNSTTTYNTTYSPGQFRTKLQALSRDVYTSDYYWTSTPHSSTNGVAYYFSDTSSNNYFVNPSNSSTRYVRFVLAF